MNPTSALYLAFRKLDNAMQGTLDGTKIKSIKDTISTFAVSAAITSMLAGVLPGVAGVVAGLANAGLIWGTYVKINRTLGISMSEHTAKFIGTAILTNIVANAGTMLVEIAASAILSFIPIIGQFASGAIAAAIGYILVYVSAIIYLNLITQFIGPDGTLKVDESDDTKHIIEEAVRNANVGDLIKEGRTAFKQAKADGSLDKARKQKRCPKCHVIVKQDQRFCSECGTAL